MHVCVLAMCLCMRTRVRAYICVCYTGVKRILTYVCLCALVDNHITRGHELPALDMYE
jgi:hypothetical protein